MLNAMWMLRHSLGFRHTGRGLGIPFEIMHLILLWYLIFLPSTEPTMLLNGASDCRARNGCGLLGQCLTVIRTSTFENSLCDYIFVPCVPFIPSPCIKMRGKRRSSTRHMMAAMSLDRSRHKMRKSPVSKSHADSVHEFCPRS